MKILFRTNFGKNIGVGHLYRTLSLCEALKRYGASAEEIFFDVNKNDRLLKDFKVILHESYDDEDLNNLKLLKPDVIIFDSYLADSDYLKSLKAISKLVMFDDNDDIYNEIPANILINGNLHAKELKYQSISKNTKLLLGPEYLVMKPEYWNMREINNANDNEESILITTGGADFNRIMPKFIESLKDLKIQKKIIIGPAYENDEIEYIKEFVDNTFELIYKPDSLKKYIEDSTIVITAAGSTIYEVLTLKKVPVIYTLADNQLKIENTLKKRGIKSLGNYEEIKWNYLSFEIKEIMKSIKKYKRMLEPLYRLFDGKGALRVAKEILNEVKK